MAELGIPTVLALYESLGWDPRGLGEETARFLAGTESLYLNAIEPLLEQRLGMSLAETAPCDMGRLWRAPEYDARLPGRAGRARAAGDAGGDGHRPRRQPNVELDVEARPGKYPRAFCMPIRVPDRVVLVMLPQGGQDDYGRSSTRPATPSTSPTPRARCRPSSACWATTPSPRASPSCSST